MCSQYFTFVILILSQLLQTGRLEQISGTVNLDFDIGSILLEEGESPLGLGHPQENAVDKWFETETELVEILEKKLQLAEEEISLITEYLEDYDVSTGEAMRHLHEPKETPEERGRVVGSSAILSHLMTNRYVNIIDHIRRLYRSEDFLENEENVARILDKTQEFVYNAATKTRQRLAPTLDDLFSSMTSFFHAQHSYGYRPPQLAHDFSGTDTTGARLNALQCAELGIFAVLRGEYYIAVEWIEVAFQLLTSWEDDQQDGLQLDIVSALLRLAIQQHNRAFNSDGLLQTHAHTPTKFYTTPIVPSGERIAVENQK